MKKCPQCDKRYDDLQKFCSDCGVELIDLSWEEQNQLIAEEQKAKTKKTGIIVVACVLVLAILIGAGVMMYPSMNNKAMAESAINAVEKELGHGVIVRHCYKFEIPKGEFSEIGNQPIEGTYIAVSCLEDSYYVKMNEKTAVKVFYDGDYSYLDILYDNPEYYRYFGILMYYSELLAHDLKNDEDSAKVIEIEL